MKNKPTLAIIGRPNVGKSQLFNRITEKRLSIVENTPGVTRDRIYADATWLDKNFVVIDTGGIEPRTDDQILRFMREQAIIAIDHADVIIFITDVRTGVTAADEEVASMLKRSKKPVVLAVNKIDTPGAPPADFYEFYSLGFGDPMGISALHGYGTGDLLETCFTHIPDSFYDDDEKDDSLINVAIIGKPNAGKSSLVNRILGQERVIVSNIAGTTRDAIDSYIENDHGIYNFIDTAGLRRKSRVDESIERFSVMRAMMAIERSDVCLIMIDAVDGVTEQDTKVAGHAHENGKASIIVINKWDLIEKETNTQKEYAQKVRADLAYMDYAPMVFISALTGSRVENLYELINSACEQNRKRITTGMLNSVLADATTRVQPPTDKGRRLKIYYMTQIGVTPPTFVCFCNDAKLFHYSYLRYLENQVRNVFGFEGTPIRMIVRQRGEKD